MTDHLCIPTDAFERIVQALPHLTVSRDETHQFIVADGVTFATPLLPLDGAA